MITSIINLNMSRRRIIHVWYDVEEKIDVTWNGRITRVEKTTKSKDSLLAINYWEKV